jgi:hypothetical protein
MGGAQALRHACARATACFPPDASRQVGGITGGPGVGKTTIFHILETDKKQLLPMDATSVGGLPAEPISCAGIPLTLFRAIGSRRAGSGNLNTKVK